jgi:hypothetical protein
LGWLFLIVLPFFRLTDLRQVVEWSLFTCAYVLVGLRLGVRILHQQQKRIIVSDIFLVFSALMCLGLIICE